MLLVKQPVPISPVRTQLPGARVLLIVHSVHTSGRQGPGRLETNYVLKKSLFVPQSSTCVCRPPLLYSQVTRVRRTERGRVSEAQTLPWYDLQILTSNTIALGLQGLRQHFQLGEREGFVLSLVISYWKMKRNLGPLHHEIQKGPGVFIVVNGS